MNSNIQIFKKQELGQVRVAGDKNNPLFCLRDVCDILGHTNSRKAKEVIENEFEGGVTQSYIGVVTGKKSDGTDAIQQVPMTFITEPQLYFLLMRSDLPKAKPFRQWVVNDVLPQIRKTGSYSNIKTPSNMIEALELALAQAKEIESLNNKIEQDKPKVAFADSVASSDDTISIGQLAKLLKQNGIETGRKRLFDYFRKNGYLIKGKSKDYNTPSQKAMEQGLFKIKEAVINMGDKAILSLSPRVTSKGQQYFIEHFTANKGCMIG